MSSFLKAIGDADTQASVGVDTLWTLRSGRYEKSGF